MMRLLPVLLLFACQSVPGGSPAADPEIPDIRISETIHFAAPEVGGAVIPPGRYGVEEAGSGALRLTARSSGRTFLVASTARSHDEDVADRECWVFRGSQPQVRYLVVLAPGGQGREAVGYVNGVRPRGTRLRLRTSALKQQRNQARIAGSMDATLELEIDGSAIRGENQAPSREETIALLGYEDGVVVAGPTQFQPIRIVKRVDRTTPILLMALSNQQSVKGTVRFYRLDPITGGEQHFFTIEFKNGHVLRIARRGGAGVVAQEVVDFDFGSITTTHELDAVETEVAANTPR